MTSRRAAARTASAVLLCAALGGCGEEQAVEALAAAEAPVVVAAGPLALADAGAPAPAPSPSAAPDPEVLETVEGEATYYHDRYDGRPTASGEIFRQAGLTAAHPAWPFGTRLRVTNLANGRAVELRVTDRGPFGARAKARHTIVDVTRRAARELDFVRAGRTPVRVEVLAWGGGRR